MPRRSDKFEIVMIARFFPPEPSGGARRPYLYAKALREIGHKVTVVSPHGGDDPDHIYVEHPVNHTNSWQSKTDISEGPEKRQSLRDFARLWLLWPDPEIRWYRRVERELLSRDISADWLITTSPPEAAHCIGARVADHMNARWLAEFRDTWIEKSHREILRKSTLRRTVETRLAQKALRTVDAVSAVSEAVMTDVRNLVHHGTPELTIGHFSESPQETFRYDGDALHLLHAGGFALSDAGRNLSELVQALERSGRQDVHMHIIGRLTEDEIALIGKEHSYQITHHGTVPLPMSQAMQAGADGLLLITPDDSHALPGKYAEYRMAGRPILYKGGGGWLDLVEDKSALIPLSEGLKSLRKGTRVPTLKTSHLSYETAAQELAAFLLAV